jgi:hypothetical protein
MRGPRSAFLFNPHGTGWFPVPTSSSPPCRLLPNVAHGIRIQIPRKMVLFAKEHVIIDHFSFSRDRIAFAWMEPGAFLYLRVICSSPTFCYGISSTCGGCNCGCPGTWDPAFMRRQHCVNSPLLGRFLIKHLSCRSDGFLWVAFVSLHFTYKRRASVYHGICSSMHRLYKASCTATFFWLGWSLLGRPSLGHLLLLFCSFLVL